MGGKGIEWVSARVTSLLVTEILAAAVAGCRSSSLARDNGSCRREKCASFSVAVTARTNNRVKRGLNVGRAIIGFQTSA
jgi:hypothetical protein